MTLNQGETARTPQDNPTYEQRVIMRGALLECCRDATGPERRHLRVMGSEIPLCGTVTRQDNAGAGLRESLLKWPTCAK